MMIAPKRADIIDTTIKVKVHPSSPAASVMRNSNKAKCNFHMDPWNYQILITQQLNEMVPQKS